MYQFNPELMGRLAKQNHEQRLREAEVRRIAVEIPGHTHRFQHIAGRILNLMRGLILVKRVGGSRTIPNQLTRSQVR
ncbi:MAG: hypothetical protein ACE5H0_11445 [Bacteroidota bacterium]